MMQVEIAGGARSAIGAFGGTLGRTPLAEFTPEVMKGAMQGAGVLPDEVDLYEINEAFAAQALACCRQLGLDEERVNENGGAIALGHPVGATGARLILHLAYELRRRGLRRGIASQCAGGGPAMATMLEVDT